MSRKGGCGRADLALALGRGGDEVLDGLAELLGYVPIKRRPEEAPPIFEDAPSPPPEPEIVAQPLQPIPIPFWRVTGYEDLRTGIVQRPSAPVERPAWTAQTHRPPPYRLLAPWRDLEPRLRRGLGATRAGADLDIRRILRDLGRGRILHRLPRRRHAAWGASLQIILDRNEHLVPFWRDQDQVRGDLVRLLGARSIDLAVFHEGLEWPRPLLEKDADYRPPPPGGTVLVLGDLGCLTGGGVGRDDPWLRLGNRLAEAGCRAVALLPGPLARCPEALCRRWRVLPWERPQGAGVSDPAVLRQRAERLLRLISPAIRVEPGLLRAIRLSLPASTADAGTESDVWQRPELASTSSVAGTLDAEAVATARADFEAEAEETRRAVVNALTRWRQTLPPEIWFNEVRNMGPETRALCDPADVADADAFFNWLAAWRATPPGADPALREAARAFLARARGRATAHFWQGPVGAQLQQWVYQEFDDFRPGFDPAVIKADGPERRVALWQRGDEVATAKPGSRLAELHTVNGLITLDTEPPEDRNAFWKTGAPPSWAEDWGRDEFGAWVSFRVGEVVTRLRWCPPGRFLMGSPGDEPGRNDNEGPRHQVTISRGFWLMETPCTQALWQVVMGSNPSHFQSPDRPVECVSWSDAQAFIARINERLPGLGLTLPTEAQWEYACRAGTYTALYSGDIEILGANNAPALDAIAWYGGNSGVGFDLENGFDSRSWPDKQYPHERAGTRPVKGRHPNQWGLHDMLGNVWEWCRDGRRKYLSDAQTDPTGPPEAAADRTLRGGSWTADALRARAAYRGVGHPGARGDNVGFRCSLVQIGCPASEPHAVAETTALARDRKKWSINPSPGPASVAGDEPERPEWADAFGHDTFGPWASFTLEADGERVSQRLRWIPPGRFLMGSPEDEKGRFEREGPQHEVTLSQGYWLMETPCTQALWRAVMSNNPSGFKGASALPVETVSWNDVQKFLDRLNRRVSGLELTLPTEAEWEYACRAGSGDARYGAVDAIGWYSANSGRQTHPVGEKQPNRWGLHDMLGNVWEWCRDGRREYSKEAQTDPAGPLKARTGRDRALRGGSWNDGARDARAAYRYWYHPDFRYHFFGFRCSRVHAVSPASRQEGAEPPGPAWERNSQARANGAVLRLDRGEATDSVTLPRAPTLWLKSDCERLTLERFTLPDWAEAIGRDRFGLWARFEIGGVCQRLRWLPPGRFLMGSPEDEPEQRDNEGPQHPVTLSQGFWLMDTACTQELWQVVMGDNPSRFKDDPKLPVEQVSWNDVQTFLAKINAARPGLALTLPTEAQWEYACRAGTTMPFSFGATITPQQVNYKGSYPNLNGQNESYRQRTVPVASLPPNPWGLYEMHGNVWEWCLDDLRDYSEEAQTDPIGPLRAGTERALRGGSWFREAWSARSVYRGWSSLGDRVGYFGFRCVRHQTMIATDGWTGAP